MASTDTQDGESEEERLRRIQQEREEAMEQMLLQQEQQQAGEEDAPANQGENEQENDPARAQEPNNPEPAPVPQQFAPTTTTAPKLSYRQGSFLAAAALLFYAFRTRKQYYLAAVFLSSSKWAYVIMGNALVAGLIAIFDHVTAFFLSGLRLHEAEGLQDFFRWNVTETCLALTMFRAELQLSTAVQFLLLILVKCLHQVAILREQHVRMTQDAIVPWRPTGEQGMDWPVLRSGHIRLVAFLILLQFVDLMAAQHTVHDIMTHGPSVNILFAFEAAILLMSAWSHLLLWHLNVLDSLLQYGHEQGFALFRRLLHPWKEYKATLIFAVELQSQAVQFMFYLTFFSIVLTYYGMPINLFREVYMSFAALKERLQAFFKYRQLMASMNRFPNGTAQELQENGATCIICRDEMTEHDCKRLPVCKHIFHKSCLREWLVQQQSCPTCRSDIATMQRQEAAAVAAAERAEALQQQEQPQEQQQQQRDRQQPQQEETGQGNEPEQRRQPVASDQITEPALIQETEGIPSRDVETKQRRDKKVRFVDGKVAPTPQFPALYKVVKEGGAEVSRIGRETRTIPQGYLVLCQGELKQSGETPVLLQIPDGWIDKNDLAHVHTIITTK